MVLGCGASSIIPQSADSHPSPSAAICVQDPGGASVGDACFRSADGTINLIHQQDLLEVSAASESYRSLIADACNAMQIPTEDCDILPMFAPISANAIAATCEGAKVVLFDRNISDYFGASGARFAIYHEVGHHFCGHLDGLCAAPEELEADLFAGAAMQRLGFSLEETMSILEVLDGEASRAYPDRTDREDAITTGWKTPEAARKCR